MLIVESIINGYLVHIEKSDPDIEKDTWYAKDDVEVYRLIKEHYFGAGQ